MKTLLLWWISPWKSYERFNGEEVDVSVGFSFVLMSCILTFLSVNVWGLRLADLLPSGQRELFGLSLVFSTIGVFLAVLAAWPICAFVSVTVISLFSKQPVPFRKSLGALGYAHAPLTWICILQLVLGFVWPLNGAGMTQSVDDLVALVDSPGFLTLARQLQLLGAVITAVVFTALLSRLFRTQWWKAALAAGVPYGALMVLQLVLASVGGVLQ